MTADNLSIWLEHNFPKARERLNDFAKGGGKVQKRERISRSRVGKQHEGECTVM